MIDHDPSYRACLDAAKRDFTALQPQFLELQKVVSALRAIIHHISFLLGEDVDDEFQYPYLQEGYRGRSSLRGRPAGRAPIEAQHEGK